VNPNWGEFNIGVRAYWGRGYRLAGGISECGGSKDEMVAITRGFGGVVLRLLAAGAGIDIEGASPVAAVFHGASESTGALVRENRR